MSGTGPGRGIPRRGGAAPACGVWGFRVWLKLLTLGFIRVRIKKYKALSRQGGFRVWVG